MADAFDLYLYAIWRCEQIGDTLGVYIYARMLGHIGHTILESRGIHD